jgi:4-amino-4-deoxy-L-arabinose transferase-like glycosyltransferase
VSGEDERRAGRMAVLLFALARTVFCGYRAATQSITVDEATTYLQYARGHWADIWSNYNANNHILYSILARLSVRAFHISDFTLRLPSVLAGFFFAIGVYRVLEETVASRATRWIALVGLCTAPLLLDFSVAARGYGLSLALLVWAIYFSVRGREVWAGVFLGLSLAANFNIAFPALGLIAYPFFLAEGSLERRLRRTLPIGLSAAAVFGAICGPVLLQMQPGNFYVGEASIRTALYELVFTFIRATPGHPGWFGGGDGAHATEYVFLPAMLLFTIAVSARAVWKKQSSPRALAPAFALVLALAAIAGAHILIGFNYPVDRMGLYLFLLLGLAWAIAASLVQDRRVRAVNAVLAILLIAQFLTQLHTSFLALWVFDAPIKRMAQRIGEEVRGKPPGSISVSAEWFHTPALEYYRDVYRLSALKPVERFDTTPLQGFDFYVIDGYINATPQALRLIPLIKDDLSGVLLAREP